MDSDKSFIQITIESNCALNVSESFVCEKESVCEEEHRSDHVQKVSAKLDGLDFPPKLKSSPRQPPL